MAARQRAEPYEGPDEVEGAHEQEHGQHQQERQAAAGAEGAPGAVLEAADGGADDDERPPAEPGPVD